MVWRSLSFALMLPFAAGATAGAAPDLPSPDALRALVAAASGARPVSYEERLRFTTSGAAGTETLLRAGDDFREIDDSGPLHRERGRYHGQDWHQNANGQTVLEQPDPGNGKRDDIVTTVARVTKPIDAFALRALNQVGSGTVTYIDPATDRVVREDRIEPAQTTVFTFDDFRSVDGSTTAWHWTRSDGHPENDGDYRVTSITPRSVAPNEVAIADPRRRLVEFPAGKTSVDLPVHMVGNNFIVRVTIAGRGFDFLLDTGTPNIQLDESVARGLGLTPLRSMSSSDFGGRVTEAAIVIPQAQVGDLRMHDIVALTIPRFPGGEAGTRIVGRRRTRGRQLLRASLLEGDRGSGRGRWLLDRHGRSRRLHPDAALPGRRPPHRNAPGEKLLRTSDDRPGPAGGRQRRLHRQRDLAGLHRLARLPGFANRVGTE